MRAVVSIEAKLHKTQDKTGKGIPNSSLSIHDKRKFCTRRSTQKSRLRSSS